MSTWFKKLLPAVAVLALAACGGGNSVTTAPRLDALTVSAGTLNPAFDPAVTAYSATVPFGTLSVTVTATSSTAMTVSQDAAAAAPLASGAPSPAMTVPALGTQSMITISVGTASKYTIQLVEANDATATLASLAPSVGTLSPAFDANTASYSMTVPNGTTSLKLTPTATDSTVKTISIAQDGGTASTATSGKASAALKIPALGATSTIVITVTAQNGITTQAYGITLSQAGNGDASLASLRASTGTFTPTFASGTTTYTLTVPTGSSTVTLTPTANNTTVRSIVLSQSGGAAQTIANGAASTAIAVPAVGTTVNLSLAVTAQDGSSVVTYSIALKQQPSVDAALSALTVSTGALSPVFAAGTFAYSVSVPFGTSSITVTPTAHDATHASITVAQNGGAAAAVNSGAASAALPVPAPGTTTAIAIAVTAQDGTTTSTYTVSVTQQSGADATLASLALSAGTLSPVFAGATHAYTAVVPHGTASLTVTPTATNALAHSITVSQDGGAAAAVLSGHASAALTVPAVGATSNIVVTVVSQDQASTITYSVAVSQAASVDSTLSSLVLSDGTLRPAFS
ncbi:MAG TPA: cadherin-like beta sandwich domain-containing protein, partial [Myxococcales bacterium]|nr:cadherin-like beta sandwich domain-containing protein [Myxococcales bacterium]